MAALILTWLKGGKAERMLQGIASGLLGRASFSGGTGSAIVGVACHFTIALGASAVYYFASRRIAFLRRRPVQAGVLYGLAVYCFMYLIVIPQSAIGRITITGVRDAMTMAAIHIVCVGLPIAWTVSRGRR